MSGNYVRGCVDGIRGSCANNSGVSDNVVEDCSGNGYTLPSGFSCRGPDLFTGNLARRCGGRGFDIGGVGIVVSNCVAEDCGAEGIVVANTPHIVSDNVVLRSGGAGMVLGTVVMSVTNNRVIDAHGDGLVIAAAQAITGNIVGRSTQRGLVLSSTYGPLKVRNNTLYLNGTAGLDLHSTESGDSLTNNVAFANAVGLAWSGTPSPFLGCNDWFGNASGSVTGAPIGATDVSLNPLFCDLPNDIVSLSAGSPLVSLAGCGRVGALGVGCTAAVSVPGVGAATLGHLRIAPQPSRGATRFTWSPVAGPVELALYDVTGARRWSRAFPAGVSEHVWTGVGDDGAALPAGVYFARLTQGTARSDATVVVVH